MTNHPIPCVARCLFPQISVLHATKARAILALTIVVLMTISLSALAQSRGEKRLALVVYQSDYRGLLEPVLSAPSEAAAIRSALENAKFKVEVASNLKGSELAETIALFRIKLERAGDNAIGFLYYTGHGAQHPTTHQSYLLGTDAKLRVASDYTAYGVSLEALRDQFKDVGARATFLVFDACRNTPSLPGHKASVKGLASVASAPDMLIAYATQPGSLAEEGAYAPVLAKELRRSGELIEAVFAETQRKVAEQTDGRQRPWSRNDLYERFCFVGPCDSGGDRDGGIDPDTQLWLTVNGHMTANARCRGYANYIEAFPKGKHIAAARVRLTGPECSRVDTGTVAGHRTLTPEEEAQAWFEWQRDMRHSTNPKNLERFIDRYPTGKAATAARERLRNLTGK